MSEVLNDRFNNVESSDDILANITLAFDENLIVGDSANCEPYGCSCIAYEKCCGCLLQ